MSKSLFLIAFLILCNLSTTARSETIRSGISHWPPFMVTEGGALSGIATDVLNEVAGILGYDVELQEYPWNRLLKMLRSGSLDCMPLLARNDVRSTFANYMGPPYYNMTSVFYVQKGSANLIQDYNDLYSQTVGVEANSEYFDPFNDDNKIQKQEVNLTRQLFLMLDNDRISTFAGTEPQVSYQLAQQGYLNKFEQAAFKPNNDVGLYIACSKQSPFANRQQEFEQAIQQLQSEGRIQQIVDSYITSESHNLLSASIK